MEIRIVNENREEVLQGEVGEITFRGPNVMKGYYKNLDATKETVKDNWVFTGDLGYQDEDEYVYIVDRKKDLIIRGGFNVYPREIEEVLYKSPQVIECAVIGVPDPILGEEIAAFIVCNKGINVEEISRHCREYLAGYKIPRMFKVMDSLPKSSIGKILKTQLREMSDSLLKS